MKQIYSYTEAKNASDDDTERMLYYFHPTIMKGTKRLYRITINNEPIDLDKAHMKEVRKRVWKPDDKYTLVLLKDTNITVYYK